MTHMTQNNLSSENVIIRGKGHERAIGEAHRPTPDSPSLRHFCITLRHSGSPLRAASAFNGPERTYSRFSWPIPEFDTFSGNTLQAAKVGSTLILCCWIQPFCGDYK